MSDEYDDIINLPRPVSRQFAPMPLEKRAAQFAPFAALTGHDDAIAETERLTDEMAEVTFEEREQISLQLADALEHRRIVKITYFVPDATKEGGSYRQIEGKIRRIDPAFNELTMADSLVIPLSAITSAH